MTFREDKTTRQIKVHFLVIEFLSLYNFFLGRPTLVELTFVPSTIYLKMKYYTERGYVVTMHEDIEAMRRCF